MARRSDARGGEWPGANGAGAGQAVNDAPREDVEPAGLGPLTRLEGVGAVRAARLARLGLVTIRDLLLFAPRALEDAPRGATIAEARERRGERVAVTAVVRSVRLTRTAPRRSLVRATLADSTGSIDALFFNQPWMRERLVAGETRVFTGRVVDARGPALASPRLGSPAGASADEPAASDPPLEPRYALTEGISQAFLERIMADALRRFAAGLEERLPEDVRARLGVPPLEDAVREAHRPSARASFDAARRRIALETVLGLQARLFARRRAWRAGRARAVPGAPRAFAELAELLPFELTEGQRRVARELAADLGRPTPMHRLMQGDVGSGKTALAVLAAAAVARAGGQTAFLAPTEILAEQHAYGCRELFARAGVRSELFTGSLRPSARRELAARIAGGEVDVVIGTHALLGAGLAFARLDLALIDEQHRFGVGQRAALAEKGEDVHRLFLTATPIPRSLALTLYGDLDVSLLAGLPPGRGRITTRRLAGREGKRVLRAELETRLAAGELAFWVCPRIGADEDAEGGEESNEAVGATRRYETLSASPLARHGIELVHGRLPAEERARRLDRFRRGESRVLVATTVVEVGVDVPAATVMVIESAERLGLAQLHQLRGRVGRGPRDAVCFVLGAAGAADRLRTFERTLDGFELAEEDLRRRGMGDLAGLRQSGENLEGLADPILDTDLLLAARDLIRNDRALEAWYARSGRAAPDGG